MSDPVKLRNMVSHRVTFDYEDGTRVIGYLATCRPGDGPVRVVVLSRAQVLDAKGQLVDERKELHLIPSILTGYRVTEGPGGF